MGSAQVINCIIQARLNSTRFPGKVLQYLGETTIIGHVLYQCQQVKFANVIVAIPANKENDELAKYLTGFNVVRGADKNVAKRFKKALNEYPCDAFVRICADSPFIMPELICAVGTRLQQGWPYAFVKGAPGGHQPQGCSTELFKYRYPNFTEAEKEHVLIGIQHDHPDNYVDASNMCVDYPSDLERLRSWL